MDIKAEIEKLVAKVTGDEEIKAKFSQDPVGTVRGFVGDKVDSDTVQKIVEAVKAAIASGKLGSLGDKIGSLLGIKKDDDAAAEGEAEAKPEGGGLLGGLGNIGGMLGGMLGGKKDAAENKDE